MLLNLRFIAKGATNEELTENLVLAIPTAKEDVSKILHLLPQERMGNIDYQIHSVSGSITGNNDQGVQPETSAGVFGTPSQEGRLLSLDV